jgi:uncharacterized protein YecT (DUF1311 family)
MRSSPLVSTACLAFAAGLFTVTAGFGQPADAISNEQRDKLRVEQAEADLGRVLEQALSETDRMHRAPRSAQAKAQLTEAQEAWRLFRDSHCRAEVTYSISAVFPRTLMASCLERKTRERIDELKKRYVLER